MLELKGPHHTRLRLSLSKGLCRGLCWLRYSKAPPCTCLPSQANLEAPAAVPKSKPFDVFLYQLTHLRLCLDEVSSTHAAQVAALGAGAAQSNGAAGLAGPDSGAGSSEDIVASLAAKQRLRGRDRHPSVPIAVL